MIGAGQRTFGINKFVINSKLKGIIIMAGIEKSFLKSVVALGISTPTPKDKDHKHWVGTGFLVGFHHEKDEVYLITNKHVVQDQEVLFIRFNTLDGAPANDFPLQIKDDKGVVQFSFHPNPQIDIVAVSLNLDLLKSSNSSFDFYDLEKDVYTLEQMENNQLHEGSLVYALGFPMNLVDQDRQYPICRLGCISRISNAFDIDNAVDFLVDAQTFPGNSGGPIVSRAECATSNQKMVLLGILRAYITYQEALFSMQTGRQRSMMEENSGLTIVHPVDRILEVVEFERKRISLLSAVPKRKIKKTPSSKIEK